MSYFKYKCIDCGYPAYGYAYSFKEGWGGYYCKRHYWQMVRRLEPGEVSAPAKAKIAQIKLF